LALFHDPEAEFQFDPEQDLIQCHSYCFKADLDVGGVLNPAEEKALVGAKKSPAKRLRSAGPSVLGFMFSVTEREDRIVTFIPNVALIVVETCYFTLAERETFRKIVRGDRD